MSESDNMAGISVFIIIEQINKIIEANPDLVYSVEAEMVASLESVFQRNMNNKPHILDHKYYKGYASPSTGP